MATFEQQKHAGDITDLRKSNVFMKKIITCASLAALGATSLQAQYLGDAQPQKPWMLSARVHGFYDDNYTTRPSRLTTVLPSGVIDTIPGKRSSWGVDLNPSASYSLQRDLTTLKLSYEYDMRYYEDRKSNSADHSHQAELAFGHSFTERYKLDITDSFVVAQEPDIIDPGTRTAFLRTDGNNIRNTAVVGFNADLTEKLSSRASYSNRFYDYQQEGEASRSALMDRMEHVIGLDARWHFQPTTTGLVGYMFEYDKQSRSDLLGSSMMAYNQYAAVNGLNAAALTAPQQVAALATYPIPTAKIRDRYSHYAFVGLDHTLTTQLSAQLRVGAQFTTFPNKWQGIDDSYVSPYADANIRWQYTEGSVATLGVKHSQSQIDVGYIRWDNIAALDSEATTLYGSVNHKITAKLNAVARFQLQYGEFNGTVTSLGYKTDIFTSADIGLNFEVNKYVVAEAGYQYDNLNSDIPERSFARNRVYVGFRATY